MNSASIRTAASGFTTGWAGAIRSGPRSACRWRWSRAWMRFLDMLAGARRLDRHFRSAPLGRNMPVLLALIALWNRNFLGASSMAVLPYDNRLDRFPAFLQQLQMESNGKRVCMDGPPGQRQDLPGHLGRTRLGCPAFVLPAIAPGHGPDTGRLPAAGPVVRRRAALPGHGGGRLHRTERGPDGRLHGGGRGSGSGRGRYAGRRRCPPGTAQKPTPADDPAIRSSFVN